MSLYEPDYSHEVDLRCSQCKDEPCDCCQTCGAAPSEACEEWCGLSGVEGMEPEA